MRGVLGRVAALTLALVLVGALGGCAEMKEKVSKAQNPAPAGEYYDVSGATITRVNERSNYAWDIDGVEHDAIADETTAYYVDGQLVTYDVFTDAEGGWDDFEDINT
ncbi:MAG: hypothetical protein JXP72_02510, partial [Coriobacteriia bacterium]|nr:hypothetical protein [Coriobacteriia bacterium]